MPSPPPDPSSPLPEAWRPRNFGEFWPLYLKEHSRPLTRRLHVLATVSGIALLAASWFGGPVLAVVGIVIAYALAWIAHFRIEHNRPATFSHPLWSLLGDLRMTALFLAGRLDAELHRRRIGVHS